MKCQNCGIDVSKQPLLRINEKGVDGIFWCHPCIKKNEPELYNNLIEEQSNVEQLLIDILYKK